jgi:DNA-binding protein H-NS
MLKKSLPTGSVADMKKYNLKLISVDELWTLHLEICGALERRIEALKTKLETRLGQLQTSRVPSGNFERKRRSYPQVFPKYRNPAKPVETWAGRGRQPRWLTAELKSGKKLDDFRIQRSSGRARRAATRS